MKMIDYILGWISGLSAYITGNEKTIVLLQNEQNNQAIETTIKNESEMAFGPFFNNRKLLIKRFTNWLKWLKSCF